MELRILNTVILICLAIFLPGVINRVRAWLSGRKGVSVFQHVHNVGLMLRKSAIYAPATSLLFRVVPAVYVVVSFTAMLFIPVGRLEPLLHFDGDVVMFAYLLALTRMSLILAAMDTGSSFQGMGASREALYGALIEPALFIVAGTLAMITGLTSFSAIFSGLNAINPEIMIVMLLLSYTLIKVITVEIGRIPVDDSRTHLELTMIHEVMVLDYCGIDLALINIGGWFKMAALAVLAANAAAATLSLNSFVVVALSVVVVGAIGVAESFQARNRMSRNTTYILTIVALAFVVFMVAYISLQNII